MPIFLDLNLLCAVNLWHCVVGLICKRDCDSCVHEMRLLEVISAASSPIYHGYKFYILSSVVSLSSLSLHSVLWVWVGNWFVAGLSHIHIHICRTSPHVRRSHVPPPWRPFARRTVRPLAIRRRLWLVDGGANRPSITRRDGRLADVGAVCRRPSSGSSPPLLSIWGRSPAPSALYDSYFSFLDYVFASLFAVTWSDSIPKKLVENSL